MTAPSAPAGDVANLAEDLRAYADCDARAGEPLGKRMRLAATALEALSRDLAEARAALGPFANASRNGAQVQYLTADGWIGDLTQEARRALSVLSTQPKETPDVA